MEALIPNSPLLVVCLATATIIATLVGYLLGSRASRKQKRDLQRELNQQSLDMLDIKSKHAKLTKFLGQSNRKDRLLKLTLKQLTESKQRSHLLQQRLNQIDKHHYIETSRLRLQASQSDEKARRSSLIASHATIQLKRMEKMLPATQTINAPPPKSYGQAAAVPVKVVDQHSPKAIQDSIVRVSNRDSARFTRLQSSNEGRCFNSANLQAIDGINQSVEEKLNKMGIHRVEQLANMSDADLAALNAAVNALENGQSDENYTADWKGGAQRLLTRS